jgi:hypothetical protein
MDRPFSVAAIFFALGIAASFNAIPVSTAQAAWGCGTTDGVATGRSWGFRNQAAASFRALAECSQRSTRGGCRVVSCSSSVNTYYDAHVTWFKDADTPPVERSTAKAAETSVRISTKTTSGDKCTSVQARCAMEVGARCNPRTGYWCIGRGQVGNNYCGGSNIAWLACLDRVRAAQK